MELTLPAAIGEAIMTDDLLRVVIVDDEPLARAVVREYLERRIRASRSSPSAATASRRSRRWPSCTPDLVFLDVQMPKLTASRCSSCSAATVPVIFTTAYDQYALRAFEVHAVDYLLKPFSEERFAEALSRARARLAARERRRGDVDALVADARPRQGPLERVLIRDGAQVHVLPVEQDRLRRGAGRLRLLQGGRASST